MPRVSSRTGNLANHRTQDAVVDQRGDAAKLIAAGVHKEEFVAHAQFLGPAPNPGTEPGKDQLHQRVQAYFAGKRRIRRTGNAYDFAARAQDAQGLFEILAAEGIQHQVITVQQLLKVGGPVIDDGIRAEAAHKVGVGAPGSCCHLSAQMLGQLDGDRSDAART